MSPRTRMFLFAMFMALAVTAVMYLLDVPFGWADSRVAFGAVIAILLLFILLARIVDRLKYGKLSD